MTIISTSLVLSGLELRYTDNQDPLVVLAGVRYQNTDANATIFLENGSSLISAGHTGRVEVEASTLGSVTIGPTGFVEGGIGFVSMSEDDTSSALYLTNSGTIFGWGARGAIDAQLNSSSVVMIENSGTLSGNVSLDGMNEASIYGAQSVTLTNTGRILGYVSINVGALEQGEVETYTHEINNTGLMLGGFGAYKLGANTGAANISFINGGGVIGFIDFSFGHDFYRAIDKGYVSQQVNGGGGDDRLIGGTSTDKFLGEEGRDVLAGRQDDDTLVGGFAADKLYGGAGEDVFKYNSAADSRNSTGVDVIFDFSRSEDVLNLRGLVAGELTYIDDDRFTGKGLAEVRSVLDKRKVLHVYADLDGDGKQDFHILLRKQTAILNDDDFLL